MKVRLKVLPDKPRDGAWPTSVRAVGCAVKSVNEQDLYLQLLTSLNDDRAHCRDCPRKWEEGVGNVRSVCLESSGLHAHYNAKDNGIQLRKEKSSLETLAQFRLRVVTHPHEARIPSNRISTMSGE